MVTYLVQFGGARLHSGPYSWLAPFILVAFVFCIGAVALPLLGWAVSCCRGGLRARRGRRRGLRAAAVAEQRARAMMSELCPHGWRAQITIGSEGAVGAGSEGAVASGSGPAVRGANAVVALDWTELRDESGRPAVMRRVWAPTVAEALEAMVADRRTDQTLEQIEQGAVADGARWPDL